MLQSAIREHAVVVGIGPFTNLALLERRTPGALSALGPADGVERIPGHWRPLGPRQIAASFASERVEDYAFEIVSVEATMLRRRLIRMPDAASGGPGAGRP